MVEEIAYFWEEEAQMGIYPRKMAVWLSDYLEELGYPNFTYQIVYDLITHRVYAQEEKEKLLEYIKVQDPDVKPRIRTVDLKLPETDKGKFLAEQIDNYLIELPQTIKSSIYYFDQNGKMSTIETENDVIQLKEDPKNLSCTIMFENPLDSTLKDVTVNNIIPYGYKVQNYNTIGFEGIKSTKKLLDDGLQLSFTLPEIKPNQEAGVKINLERRVSRTILMNIKDETKIINTFFNISPFRNIFYATDGFTNVYEDIDNLIFEDEIPSTFSLIEAKPNEDEYQLNMEKDGFDQLIKWQYFSLLVGTKINHVYNLIDRKIILMNKFQIKSKSDNRPILELIRLAEPNIKYYELIVSYYLKFYKNIDEIYIKERIPENLEVSLKIPKFIEKSIEIHDNSNFQIWKIIPEIAKDEYYFGYICFGNNIKNEFPIELYLPQFLTSLSEESSQEQEKKTFFVPQLHKLLNEHKKN
ncbi:MAG: hypothetical protein ACTSO9_17390 [Candidatus Helarchaeota archaeon]